MPQRICVLGATGSIGTQTLQVLAEFPDRFEVTALAAGCNVERLAEQIKQFKPQAVCVASVAYQEQLQALLPTYRGEILCGPEGLKALAVHEGNDIVVVGLVGMRGLAPTLAALQAGKKVLTANKETFVTGGHLVRPYLKQIIPIDSEHVAIHQCLKHENPQALEKIYLTASGGPFRTRSLETFAAITREEALQHPNWVMGPKITIDSATMMNKGLEVIEAHWLFGVPYEQIEVVVHPQSVVHSGVAFIDGSVLMQLGTADMRGPILYALGYPERLPTPFASSRLSLAELSQLQFEAPDLKRFACIGLAYQAGKLGPAATAALNAADEVAVQLFLDGQIGFTDIAKLLQQTLEQVEAQGFSPSPTLDEIHAIAIWAQQQVEADTKLRCLA